jgi:two-component system LytT family response regulator
MKIRTLIVDDMPLARELIKESLASEEEFEIVAECEDGGDAIAAIKTLKPDLVFLDVQMPEVGGFEVIEYIGIEQMPVVIFVTAYDEFALRAFEACALDYLLKPFKKARLIRTLERAKREINLKHVGRFDQDLTHLMAEVKREGNYLQRIIVKSGEQTILLSVAEIDWISGAGNYLEIHVGKEIYLIRERLNTMERKLNPDTFSRIHRSTIINLNRIKAMHRMFHGDHLIYLNNGTELNMSRTYYEKLLLQLNNI